MKTKTSRGPGNLNASFGGPHLAEVALELIPGEGRVIGTEEIVRRWRKLMPSVPGVKEVGFFSSLFSAGEPVNVQLSSKYMDDLLEAKDELKRELALFPGVLDVKDQFKTSSCRCKLWYKYDDAWKSGSTGILWFGSSKYPTWSR
jgi:hypothetical protein